MTTSILKLPPNTFDHFDEGEANGNTRRREAVARQPSTDINATAIAKGHALVVSTDHTPEIRDGLGAHWCQPPSPEAPEPSEWDDS